MSDAISTLGRRALAIGVLVVAGYVLFKLVIGLVASVAFVLVAILAVLAILWALRTL